MVYPGAPVDMHTQLGGVITKVVKGFTKKNNLDECIAWYHDEPIWFVKKRQDNVVKRVQVAAFHRENDYLIRLIPDAYLLEKDRVVKHIGQDVIEKKFKTLAIPIIPDLSIAESELEESLREAWKEAEALKFP